MIGLPGAAAPGASATHGLPTCTAPGRVTSGASPNLRPNSTFAGGRREGRWPRPGGGACPTGSVRCAPFPAATGPGTVVGVRIESSVSSITWIPSEAVTGTTKLPFAAGIAHYDAPPPDTLAGPSIVAALEELRAADRFRFASHLRAWIDVEDGTITGYGQDGAGMIGSTTLNAGRSVTVAAVPYRELRPEPTVEPTCITFRQSAGGRTGVPAPRRVHRPPFVQIVAPTAWTTLELTIHVDGRAEPNLVGASPFPRHWVYDAAGSLCAKSGLIDFKGWYRRAFGKHTPWGDDDSPALATEVESALERELSLTIMGGATPRIQAFAPGARIVEQGDPGDDVFLVLDGVVAVEVDGERLAELGPGAVIGERAVLEGGRRTATVIAVTRSKVAAVPGRALDPTALDDLRAGHRREARTRPAPS